MQRYGRAPASQLPDRKRYVPLTGNDQTMKPSRIIYLRAIILILLASAQFSASAQQEFYSVSPGGGKFMQGAICKYVPGDNAIGTVADFGKYPGMPARNDEMYLHSDGKLYAFVETGMSFGVSVFDPSDNSYSVTPFRSAWGVSICGKPAPGSGGLLYGAASIGPPVNERLFVFAYNIASNTFQIIADFPEGVGAPLTNLTKGSDGKYYFLAYYDFHGAVMCYDPAAPQESAVTIAGAAADVHLAFNGTVTADLVEAEPGKLYGASGVPDHESVFVYDFTNDSLYVKKSLAGINTVYGYPQSLTRSGDVLYLIAGSNSTTGAILTYDIAQNETTDVFSLPPSTWGNGAAGKLTQTNGAFYGVTAYGSENSGMIYRFEPLDEDHEAEAVYEFQEAVSHGIHPAGTLTLHFNGKLYGRTSSGAFGNGNLFSFDPVTGIYESIFATNDPHNTVPENDLVRAADGMLYGTLGNLDLATSLYRIDPSTDEIQILTELPEGEDRVVHNAAPSQDGKIYIPTYYGTTSEIFGYDPATGQTAVVYQSEQFPQMTDMTEVSPGEFYGFCRYGESFPSSGICHFSTSDGTTSSIAEWSIQYGDPLLRRHTDGKLYGIAFINGFETLIFSISADGTPDTLYSSNSLVPLVNVFCIGSDDKIYGLANFIPETETLKMYSFDLHTHGLTVLNVFDYELYGFPQPSPLFSSNNKIWFVNSGTFTEPFPDGTVLSYSPATNLYALEAEFDIDDTPSSLGFIETINPSAEPDCEDGYCWHLFPNPATNEVHLNSLTETPISITIFSYEGSPVYENLSPQAFETIDISGLNAGIYIVQTQFSNGQTSALLAVE
jgi:hypothetical protein